MSSNMSHLPAHTSHDETGIVPSDRAEKTEHAEQVEIAETYVYGDRPDAESFVPALSKNVRIAVAAVLVVLAVICAWPIANIASDPSTYAGTIQTLDEKKDNVMALTVTTAGASAGISALPGDMGTPIADKVADLSSDLLVVLSILYFEKFLLTTLGLIGFRFLVPIGLLLGVVAIALMKHQRTCTAFFKMGLKFAIFGLAVVVLIPVSTGVCDMVDRSFNENIQNSNAAAMAAANQLQESVALQEGGGNGGNNGNSQSEEKGWFENVQDAISGAVNSVSQGVSSTVDNLSAELSSLLDTMAVMIATSCLIPIAMLLLFLWVVKAITGIDIQVPMKTTRMIKRGIK